jgi:hypothetical protein
MTEGLDQSATAFDDAVRELAGSETPQNPDVVITIMTLVSKITPSQMSSLWRAAIAQAALADILVAAGEGQEEWQQGWAATAASLQTSLEKESTEPE